MGASRAAGVMNTARRVRHDTHTPLLARARTARVALARSHLPPKSDLDLSRGATLGVTVLRPAGQPWPTLRQPRRPRWLPAAHYASHRPAGGRSVQRGHRGPPRLARPPRHDEKGPDRLAVPPAHPALVLVWGTPRAGRGPRGRARARLWYRVSMATVRPSRSVGRTPGASSSMRWHLVRRHHSTLSQSQRPRR